jgi:flagellar biosynthetic protein FliS
MNSRESYREATVQGAKPVMLVVRLYEQIIEDLRQAEIAIGQNAIEQRTKRINHALLVVSHLQSPLDFANGGKVAKDLDHFYDTLRQNLVQLQFFPSKRGVTQLITDLLAVREAWIKVEQAESPSPSLASVAPAIPSVAADPDPDRVRVDWQG